MANALHQAARVLRQGGIVAYATEYCFGFGCDPRDDRAVARLLRLKRRPWHKGLIVLAADVEQLKPYAAELPKRARDTWPGPHTWLVPPTLAAPRWITGKHSRIAVRITAHPQAAALCRAAGIAIVSTSANRAGQHPARTYREAVHRFAGRVDFVLPGHVGDAVAPTPIRDAITDGIIRK